MVADRVREFLDEQRIKYVTIRHSIAFTAQEIAASAHISGREIAKTVIIWLDDKLAMAVLPASKRVSLDEVRRIVGSNRVEIADEVDFVDLFPGCEVGAMPPFGNLYGMEVYLDPSLAEDDAIAFNAGSHTELLRMEFDDFLDIVKPKILAMTV